MTKTLTNTGQPKGESGLITPGFLLCGWGPLKWSESPIEPGTPNINEQADVTLGLTFVGSSANPSAITHFYILIESPMNVGLALVLTTY